MVGEHNTPALDTKRTVLNCGYLQNGVVTLLLLAVIGCAQTLEAPTSLWETGREVKYAYTAEVRTVTLLPVETASLWKVSGALNVQATSETSIVVQLQDPTVTVMNGKASASEVNEHTIPAEAAELSQPFKLWYDTRGLLTEMRVQEGENVWAVNMKRGIASLLQLDLSILYSPASSVKERGLHGECVVGYLVQNYTADNITVTKSFDPGDCSGSTVRIISSAEKLRCPTPATPKKVLSSSSLQTFVVKESPALQKVKATGGIFFQPFRANGEMFHIVTSQTLELASEGVITRSTQMNGEEVSVQLNFQQPNGDISLGRSPPKQEDLLAAVTRMLEELGDNLEQGKLETNPRHLHTERVAHVLYFLSLLNQSSLHQLYRNLAVGTSYHQETIRNLFMEVLPQVGSQDAVLLIRDLVTTMAVKNETAVSLLMSLPFYVRNPTEDLLAQLEGLLNEKKTNAAVYRTAVLSFATLVSKACSNECSIDMMEKYVRRYLDLLTSSEGDYGKQMLYIHALSNFDQEMIFEFVRPLIQNKSNRRQLRFIAIWATSAAAHVLHKQMSAAYWPILKDRDESIEIRSAALMMLILSRPTLDRFYSLYWFMLGERRNSHLHSYWYTTLQSLIHSEYPCYMHIAEAARKVARYFPKKESNHWLTGNYIMDYANHEHGFGSLLHACIIANPNTGQPDVFYLDIGSHTDVFSFRQFSLYLRVEGVGSTVNSEVVNSDKNKLTEILNKLNLPKKSADAVHVEIAVKMQNKVILVQYINDTSARSLSQVLQAVGHLMQMGIDLNQQDLEMPFLMEQIHATDVGSPALLRVTAASLMSLRANLNLSSASLRSIKLDPRISLSLQTALMSYNPVLNMWHRVQNSRRIQGSFPLNVTLSATQPTSLVVTFHQEPGVEAGIVAHVQTDVSVRGAHAEEKLKTHCTSCESYYVVTHISDYPHEHTLMEVDVPKVGTLSVSMLHCEHSISTVYDVIDKADGYVNSKVLPHVYSWLKMLQYADFLLLVPPPGSCGMLVRLSPSPGDSPSKLEAVLQFAMKFIPLAEHDLNKFIPDVEYSLLLQLHHQHEDSSEATKLMNLEYRSVISSNKVQVGMDMNVALKDQICLTLEQDVPEVQRGVSAFTPGQEIQMMYNITWGQADQCPVPHYSGHSLEVTGTVGLLEEQLLLVTERNKQPYSDCWHDMQDTDKWGSRYAPLSPACNKVMQELHTLRQHIYTNTYSNFQPRDIPWLEHALGLPFVAATSRLDTVEMQLEVPERGLASITHQQFKTMLSEMFTAQLQSSLNNIRFPLPLKIAMNWGMISTCTVTTKSVQTFDEANGDISLSHCYTLAVTQCLQDTTSQFGVFVKRVDDAEYPLAVDLFAKKDHIEILPHRDTLIISVNGVVIDNATDGYQQPWNNVAMYDMKVVQFDSGLVVVEHKTSGVSIEYYGHFAAITITGLHQGSLCGLCGDHDNDEFNDVFPQYSIPCTSQAQT